MLTDCSNVLIKNEPIIDTDDTDFVTDAPFPHNVVSKCKNMPPTVICSEIEYLAEGNVPFESIIVKEEQQYYDSATNVDIKLYSSKSCDKLWECYSCRHILTNAVDLRKHIRTHRLRPTEATHTVLAHKKRVNCHHKLIHKAEKSFACDQCERKFSRSFMLTQHKRIHSGIKPYECDVCDRKFSDSSAFRRHKQTHSKERPFGCDLCDQRCARKSTLIRHLGTHAGTRSFVCNICGKKFSRNSTLNHHKMLHTGQFPFECEKCGRKFVTKSSLSYHSQTHNKGEKPFKCDECNRSFGLKGTLNQHKKTHRLKTTNKSQQKQNISNESTKNCDITVTKSRTNNTKNLSKCSKLMNKCKNLRQIL